MDVLPFFIVWYDVNTLIKWLNSNNDPSEQRLLNDNSRLILQIILNGNKLTLLKYDEYKWKI